MAQGDLRGQKYRRPDDEYTKSFLSGAINAPLDALRYPGLASIYAGGWLSGAPETEVARRAQAINTFYDRPPLFSDAFNNTRERLAQKHPKTTTIGELAVGGLAGIGKVKAGIDFTKTQLNKFLVDLPTKAKKSALGVSAAGLAEYGTEPAIQKLVR